MKITTKLILSISLCISLIFIITNSYLNWHTKNKLEQELLSEMKVVSNLFSSRVESKQRAIEEIIQNTALYIQNFNQNPQHINKIMQQVMTNNQGDIFGMSLSYNPNIEQKAPYYYWNSAVLAYKDLAKAYNYTEKEWFKVSFNNAQPQWTKFYKDSLGGETLMSTYAYPILDHQKQIKYILTGDLSLAWLNDELNTIVVNKFKPLVYITSKNNNQLIAHPNQSSFELDNLNFPQSKLNDLEAVKIKDNSYYQISLPVQQYDWNINILFPAESLQQELKDTLWSGIILSLIGILLMIAAIAMISKSITKPILNLASTMQLQEGEVLTTEVPYQQQNDEIGVLARSFHQLQQNIQKHILEVQLATSEKQRLESELQVGHKIQHSLLPPQKQEIDHFKIQGYLKSAREVGGDIYDYFKIGQNLLYVVIGDVSGKGVPAALHMAGIRAFIRAKAQSENLPNVILNDLNQQLCQNNDMCMFATLYCAQINLSTGQILAANAGHEFPFIKSDKDLKTCKNSPNAALGIIENLQYPLLTFQLSENECFFMYTDGVTDALNKENESFSTERLIDILNSESHSENLITKTEIAISQFSLGTDQFDDITLLSIINSKR